MIDNTSRRRFLQAAGLTTAAYASGSALTTALGQQLPKPPEPEDDKVGFAIVGLGRFSLGRMLPSMKFTQYVKPVALVSGHADKAKKVAKEYLIDPKHLYDYDTFDSIKNDESVQVVYIALPTGLHEEYTVRALKAGKHVLCEKPMAGTPEACQKMIDAASAAGKHLMIAYREQFEPYNARMIEIAKKKELGEMRLFAGDATMMIDKPEWRLDPALNGGGDLGGGPLYDLGIYMLQAARYTTGEEPAEVSGTTIYPNDNPIFGKGVEATCAWRMRFPSGVVANCSTSWDSADVNRYRNIYTKGWSELSPATSYNNLDLKIGRPEGVTQVSGIPQANEFAAEMDHMAECVKNTKTPKTPGEEGLRDIALIRRIYEAAKEGKTLKAPGV